MNSEFTNQSLMFIRSESQRFARALQPNGGRLPVTAERRPPRPVRRGRGSARLRLRFHEGRPRAAAYTWITTGRIIGRRPISLLQKLARALRTRRESAAGATLPLTSLRTISSARRINPSLSLI